MPHWFTDHAALFSWLTLAGVILFVATLLLVPAIIVRIPADYFAQSRRPPSWLSRRHPGLRIPLLIAKNLLGLVFLLAGLAMLVLPGQGLLTILLGFLLLDLPGKYRMEQWLVSRRAVLRPINWMRKRARREPLRVRARHAEA